MMSSAGVSALPFNSFDPRSMAMGGAGAAVADPSTAPFFNPALLSATAPEKKYSIEFPIIGARLYDPDNMRSNLSTLETDLNTLDASIQTTNLGSNPTSAQIQNLPANYQTVASNITKVNTTLSSLSNKPVQGEFGAASVIGVPGKNWGFAFYADAWGAMGGVLQYNDAAKLSSLSTAVSSAATALEATTGAGAAACANVQNGTATTIDVQNCLNAATALDQSLVSAQGAVQFATSTDIASKINVRGVLIGETGLAVSHGFVSGGREWTVGVTPKIMQMQLFDATIDANAGDLNGATGDDFLAKYTGFNFDLGAAKNYGNGWTTGAVIKNVIPQTYDFKQAPTAGATQVTTGSLSIKPQVRVGVARENTWSTVALDVDLTQNDPAGLENKSQYVALGGELSAWGWAQLRAGYRADLVNTSRNVASLGLGLSPRIPYFKIHTDLAVAGNANEVGLSWRLGFNF
jgi:hypothetical protein